MNIPVLLENPSKFSARPGHAGGGAYLSNGETPPVFCRILLRRATFHLSVPRFEVSATAARNSLFCSGFYNS
jgi:hypothetical protein